MEISNDDSIDSIFSVADQKPVVLVLIDSWGIAPKYSGNVFTDLKLKNFSSFVKNYPLALLTTNYETVKERYQALGGQGFLSQKVADSGLSQLNLTESEKLLDAWYHFNGQREKLLNKEDLQVLSSKTGLRLEDPKQLLSEIVKIALSDIKKGLHDFIILSLANLDLVSASGNLESTRDAAKLLDKQLGRLADAVLKQNGVLIITAAYGRAESMINMATELPQTEISRNPIPFMIISHKYQGKTIGLPDTLDDDLSLVEPSSDLDSVTPTILKILNIPIPEDLKGKSLI